MKPVAWARQEGGGRARQTRLACNPPAAPEQGQLSLDDPRRFGDYRIERFVVDGLGLRRLARADGCRGASVAVGRGDRHGADQGAEGFAVLSDILGDEDHLGDMDFKVAGTEQGVTALQMDIKITSITEEIMRIALDQARDGRNHILGEIAKALTGARDTVSNNAAITSFSIPKEKVREVIGSGGKVIREIVETTGAKIDIDDDGTVKVAAVDGDVRRPRSTGFAASWLNPNSASSTTARS